VLSHEPRQPASWLIFDVGQSMKLWAHVTVTVAGGALFFAVVAAWSASLGNFSPRWYHEPIVFPVRVALWFGGNPHNFSAPIVYAAWLLECLAAGLLLDALVVAIVCRRSHARS
jgi:hypothetical protein